MRKNKKNKLSFATRVAKNVDARDFAKHILESDTFPICLTTTYRYPDAKSIEKRFLWLAGKCEEEGMIYSRFTNPTVWALANKIADLEGAEKGICFSSGMAAVTNLIASFTKSGENIVVNKNIYGGTHKLFIADFARWNIETRMFNNRDLKQAEALIDENTTLLFVETPTNPNLDIVDIKGLAKIAKKHKTPLAVDNTLPTPYQQRPLELGADIIVHSLTKSLSGHANLVAGAICSTKKVYRQILETTYCGFGSGLGPMNAWLALTGMQTLKVRMDEYSENAMAIAEFLESHKKIEEVMYPGLKSHPAHKIAKKQMSGFGGLLALKVKGKKKQAAKFVNSTKVCERIINLGQNTTLICHPATTTNSELNEAELKEAEISGNFVRISVGLEDKDDLINDLEQALKKI